jgi:hypothetical protein
VARNVSDLIEQMKRLAREDPAALEYHLREGQIVEWLYYMKESELASQLKGVKTVDEALNRLKMYGEISRVRDRALHGRMR